MGGNSIASLFVSIGADLDGLKKGLDGAANELTQRAGGLGNAISGALTIGLGAAVIGVSALVGGLTASVQAAMEAEEGQAQLAAVLASTGGAAGVTADMANNLASSLQDVTRFEDDAILAGESMLLTFTNIGKDVFPQATETMLNMSQAMGQDLQSSAVQLGKALNDPIAGMSALARVGVTFTEEQKEMIKGLQESGDLMGAQKIILAELEKEFGNSARAAGETFAGKLDILKNKFGDLMEMIGGAILPVLTILADALINALNSDLVQGFVTQIAALFQLFASGEGSLTGFRDVLAGIFGPTVADGIMAMVPLIQNAIATIQAIFNSLVEWASGTLGPALQESFGQISEAALPALQMFGEWITTTLMPALQQLANWLGPILGEAFRGLGIFVTDMALPALTALAVWILKTGLPAFGDLANKVGGALNDAFRTAKNLWDGIVKAFQDSVKVIEETKTKLEETADAIMGPLKTAFDFFQNNIIRPTVEALAGLKQKIQEVIDMIRNLIDLFGKIPGGIGGAVNDAAGWVNNNLPTLPGLPGGGGQIMGERFGGGRGRMRAGGVQINLTYAPTVSLMDEAEAETKLSPFVRAAVRAAMGA